MNSRFILCLVLLFCGRLVAQEVPSADPLNAATAAASSALGVNDGRLPGVGIAEGISEITGVAVRNGGTNCLGIASRWCGASDWVSSACA